MSTQFRQWGFSVVELMVAIAVGAIVMAALVTITVDTLATTRVQDGMSRMQENGRYAMSRLRRDIHQMMYMPLTNVVSSIPKASDEAVAAGGSVFLNATPRTYTSYLANGESVAGFRPGALDTLRDSPVARYQIPPNFFISLHECAAGFCSPALNAIQAAWPTVPTSGTSAGDRMPGTDVITARVLTSGGYRLVNQGNPDCSAGSVGSVPGYPPLGCPNGAIALVGIPDPSQPPLNLQNGDPVAIVGVRDAVIFSATLVPGGVAALGGGRNISVGGILQLQPAELALGQFEPRLFSLREGMQAITYYVRLKEDPNQPGRMIGALVRESPTGAEELIEGVDQFNLRYGVFGNAGMTYMNADRIYDLNSGTMGCPAAPQNTNALYNDAAMGCLLRTTATVEVSLLVNTIDNLTVTGSEAYQYSAAATLPTPAVSLDPAVTPPNALPPGTMLRREFRETIRIKNNHW